MLDESQRIYAALFLKRRGATFVTMMGFELDETGRRTIGIRIEEPGAHVQEFAAVGNLQLRFIEFVNSKEVKFEYHSEQVPVVSTLSLQNGTVSARMEKQPFLALRCS
jgi:hypothetical protein